LKIAEMFYSVQGEGVLAGVPSVFIRTSGCNLRCVWCDTPYTSWEPEGGDKTLDEIAAYVERESRGHVVITGGEPMIQPDIVALSRRLHALGNHITVETAGTVFEPVECDLMSISPKTSNSTPISREEGRWAAAHDRLRIQPSVLKQLIEAYDYQLKFVVSSEQDLPEIRTLVNRLDAAKGRVLLMPEGVDANVLRERGVWLAEVCKTEGFRYCPRLHIELWGHERGK
jgi:7-carboxy-7-deazaguanine synthase